MGKGHTPYLFITLFQFMKLILHSFDSESLKLKYSCFGLPFGRGKWQSTLVFLSGESCGQRSLEGCRPQGRTESDTTAATEHACLWLSDEESTCQAGDMSLIPDPEDPLEKEMATHSSILAWEIPWTEEPGRL